MISTTCFGLIRPSSGFHPEEYQCFIGFMRLCHDGEISPYLVFIIITIKRRRWGGGGGGTVMWVCTSLGCKARAGSISYIRNSCPVWVSSLLPVLHRWWAFCNSLRLYQLGTLLCVTSLLCFLIHTVHLPAPGLPNFDNLLHLHVQFCSWFIVTQFVD